jgi:2-polyprenyl-3-methyl-5-hydroxy-6-metoxy-1,4-benzoquinol methylase
MRHSRRAQFVEALAAPERFASHWWDLASDPNAPLALVHRAKVLQAAWRPPIDDRAAFIESRCRNRKVLDIGCVAHDVERMSSPAWLHGRIAAVAERCIGVDVLASEVEEMRHRGYEVVLHDLTTGLGPIAALAPFDVIVAGELIEHVEGLDMLFTLAGSALADAGQLIITTPNPYAPARVRAGQLGIVWENVDHVVYAFPSGIAELCERHGLRLSEAAVTADHPSPRGIVAPLKALSRLVRGTGWVTAGYATDGALRHVRADLGPLGRGPRNWFLGRRPFLGETFVYVVVNRPDA